jgi:aromatic-amino-acid transaminase
MTAVQPSSLIPVATDRPGDDPIFTLHGMAMARAAAGDDILNATLGALVEDDGTLAIMPAVHEALRRAPMKKASAYAPISGPPAFLAAVEHDLFHGHELESKAVAVATPGGSGAIYNAVTNFLEPGQEALTGSYYWAPYEILTDLSRRKLTTFNLFTPDGHFDLVAFEAKLNELVAAQGRALVILNSPCHNPTGFSLNDDEWRGVTDIMAAASDTGPVTLLIDYAYAKFAPAGGPDWREHVARTLGKVPCLVAWTASKSFAQYGARVGALVALHEDPAERDRMAHAMGYTCRGTWSNCNHLGMLAMTDVMTDDTLRASWDAERARLVKLLDARVEVFNRLAAEHGLKYPRYEGGFFVSVFSDDPAVTIKSMQDDGVFIVPLQGAVRVGLCATPEAQIPRLVASLAKGIAAAKK